MDQEKYIELLEREVEHLKNKSGDEKLKALINIIMEKTGEIELALMQVNSDPKQSSYLEPKKIEVIDESKLPDVPKIDINSLRPLRPIKKSIWWKRNKDAKA